MQIDPVIDEYLSGRQIPRHVLRQAFTNLGEETKFLNAKTECYEEYRTLEKRIFEKRNQLVASVNPEGSSQNSNSLIHELLKTEEGNKFFYDVILPLYRPAITAKSHPYMKNTGNEEDFVSAMVFGRHMQTAFDDGTPKGPFNYSGGLFAAALKFNGDSNFHTYLQSTIMNNAFNWYKSQSRRHIPLSELTLDGDISPDDTADRVMGEDEHALSAETFIENDATAQAENFWQQKLQEVRIKPQRKAIVSMVVQGIEQTEIAKTLGIPEGTVRSSLYYMRQLTHDLVVSGERSGQLDGIEPEDIWQGFVNAVSHNKELVTTR